MTFKRIVILVITLIFTAGLTQFVSHSENITLNKSFEEFPLQFDEWHGKKDELDDRVYNILGVEDYLLANYKNNTNDLVNVYVGFYQSQKEGDIIHSPKNCLPGAGWKIERTDFHFVDVSENSDAIRVIKLFLKKGAQRQIVFYWFQSRGRIISSEYMQKIWLIFDSITRHRTDGSFVRLISPIKRDEQTTISVLEKFTKELYPILTEHIPS